MLYYSLIDQVGEEQVALGNHLTPIFALLYKVVLLRSGSRSRRSSGSP
jgi:hypothetical protein